MSSPNIVMIFIGESGSGKSTCINYFANYFTNSSFDERNRYSNMKIVIPNNLLQKPNFGSGMNGHTERNIHDNTVSQTQECTAYNFTWNGKCVVVIDTPGFNDTDSNKDDINVQKILKKASQVPFITAILITINGTYNRLSTSIKTTLNQLRGSLPDSVFKNLFFIFTNCTEETRNFDEKLIADFNPSPERMFHMQNALFSIKDMSVLENDKLVRKMAQTWQESVETMNRIMREISRTSATSTQAFEDMRIRRERLIAHKENLIEKQKSLLNVMNALQIEKDRLQNVTRERKANEDYFQQKTIYITEMEWKEYYSTICTQHGKVQVCHENCGLSYKGNQNLAHFQRCAAANGKNCRYCKCGMNEHLHSYEIPVSKMKTVSEIIQSKKAAFDQANKAIQSISTQVKQLDSTQCQYQNEFTKRKNSLLTTIRELKQICSHFNFPEEMASTIEKLRKEAKVARDMNSKQEFNNTADAIEQLIRQLR